MEDTNFEKEIDRVLLTHKDAVYRLAFARVQNKYDADDIFQEVFLRYIRKRPRFESDAHEKAWFLRVTINLTKSMLAMPFRKRSVPLTEAIESPQDEPLFLSQALNHLSKPDRTVLHLFYFEQFSSSEIASVMDKTDSAVRMQLSRARKKLEQYLEVD